MMPMQARPAFVQFKRRAGERRKPMMLENGQPNPEAGSVYFVDEDWAEITQTGGKDKVEKLVADWISNLKVQVQAERLPREWLMHYELSYKAWKEEQAAPVLGTPIRNWPLLTPAEVENLTKLHILAVEDMAAANEETLGRYGMGARALKQKAQDWLDSKSGNGALVEQLDSMRRVVEAQTARLQLLEKENKDMSAQMMFLQTQPMRMMEGQMATLPSPESRLADAQVEQATGKSFDDFDL